MKNIVNNFYANSLRAIDPEQKLRQRFPLTGEQLHGIVTCTTNPAPPGGKQHKLMRLEQITDGAQVELMLHLPRETEFDPDNYVLVAQAK
jgi:hypothetical protein